MSVTRRSEFGVETSSVMAANLVSTKGGSTNVTSSLMMEYKEMALTWIRLNSSVKGRPNMTASDFRSWVISVFLPQVKLHHPQVPSSISERTAARWLHQLGFEAASTKKGVYIDGHERSDVVEYRKLYLRKLEILESTHALPPPVSDEPAPEPSDR